MNIVFCNKELTYVNPIIPTLSAIKSTISNVLDGINPWLISSCHQCTKTPSCYQQLQCDIAQELEKKGVYFTTHVVGFDIYKNKKAQEQLKCIAKNTDEKFFQAKDAASLKKEVLCN